MFDNSVVVVGAFPPPMHGMAAVNAAVSEHLVEAGATLVVIDISANSLNRSLATRLGRLPKIAKGLVKLARTQRLRGCALYMSVSGGYGQFYEIFFVLLARLRRMRIYLHYHSFAYLDRRSLLTHMLTVAAGPSCIHIALSSRMAERLQAQYSAVKSMVPISNATFIADKGITKSAIRSGIKTIGFISNISGDKGVFDFLELADACERERLHVKALLAGPFQDPHTERLVKERVNYLDNVEYVGPRYGNEKVLFFDSIDVLIFPTRYANEADPLTVHEAMQRNLPVIAYGRGCIPEIVASSSGLVIEATEKFVPAACRQIKAWCNSPGTYQSASRAARNAFDIAVEENKRRWLELQKAIIGEDVKIPKLA